MSVKGLIVTLAVAACVLAPVLPARADEVAQTGRAIATKNQSAIVTVTIAAKVRMSFEGKEHTEEMKEEASGFLVDPSGLVVVSLVKANPTDAVNAMFAGEEGIDVSSEISELKIKLADGKELPAKFVLRDKDLDLAFIRPVKKPEAPLPFIELAKAAKPELLDQIYLMYRLDATANRALNLTVDRVEAIVEKPRKCFVLGVAGGNAELGAPVFAADGNIAGVLLFRSAPKSKANGGNQGFTIVLPAADVADIAKQAPENEAK